ncbi:AP2 domain [Yersinia pekkanenii]|uniref:AP2 domain n=1 Tax=Yersinia pekkanenii TaxID=1288385 RepID=A0A0T9RSF4_9GAMM|nr:HNH endonuclease [Yersinia pekkanenii]CNI81435.1 AP2 domain [Yersinia pekkanenii]
MRELTQERLKELLHYDPDTGVFTWTFRRGRVSTGQDAGTLTNGYIVVGIDGCSYRAQRLAWFYMHGSWPRKYIDHINRIKTDNGFINLREATSAENQRNVGIGKGNRSGFKGVFWEPERKKWKARVQFNKRKYTLGRFERINDAIIAYENFCQKYHGQFYSPQEINESVNGYYK